MRHLLILSHWIRYWKQTKHISITNTIRNDWISHFDKLIDSYISYFDLRWDPSLSCPHHLKFSNDNKSVLYPLVGVHRLAVATEIISKETVEYIEFKFILEKPPPRGNMYFGLIDAIEASERLKKMESNEKGNIDFFCEAGRRIDFSYNKNVGDSFTFKLDFKNEKFFIYKNEQKGVYKIIFPTKFTKRSGIRTFRICGSARSSCQVGLELIDVKFA